MAENCIFCRIVSGDIPGKVVFRDDRCTAFEDLNPQAPTHVLVVPNEHVATTDALEPEHEALVGHLVTTAAAIARERGITPGGYRMVLNCNADAGQTVFHVHLHLLGGRRFTWPPG